MTRRAILIAASPESNPIPGVYADIVSWQQFLQSNPGGVWQEVVIAKDYDRKRLLAAVNSAQGANYSLVVFAGHGQAVTSNLPWPETQLFLSNGDSILERELNPGTPSCTLILDCCRRSSEEDQVTVLVKHALFFEHEDEKEKYRALYDESLKAAERGLVKIYATAVGTAAADKPSFSQHFLYRANLWAERNQGVLTLQEGISLATEAMRTIDPQQRPEYHGGRRLRHFPLAVGV
jgi:hypothetical protein